MKRWCVVAITMMTIGCTTHKPFKEIKLLGFDEDVKKGKAMGTIDADDCVYRVLNFWLGDQPSLDKAVSHARTQKKASFSEATGGGQGESGEALRYINNVRYENGGFDAGIFAKSCINVSAKGYK